MGDTPTKAFQRRKENFTCEKCGNEVTGNGYTNHCSKCLHSKHVDINPGDRAASCLGLMEPIGLEIKSGSTSILHRCVKCGFERKNKASQQDSQEALISLSVAEY